MSVGEQVGTATAPGRARGVDRRSVVPLHLQLKDVLESQIASGELTSGSQLPGEHVLCEMYGVSRTVVRQTLAALEAEHVIDKRKGIGTFVAQRRMAQSLVQHLGGLHDDIRSMGLDLRSDVLRLTIELADDHIAERLQIPVATPVVVLERLRHVDGEPWVHAVSHLPVAIAPDLVTLDLREESLYAVLRDRFGIVLVSSDRVVEAVVADAELAAALDVPVGAAILKLTSVTFDAHGRAVETFVAHHRADRSRFAVHLTRSDDAPAGAPMYLV